MTDSEKKAERELQLLHQYAERTHSSKYPSLLFEKLAKPTSTFKDQDGNNIGDFFLYNAKDNYGFTIHHNNTMTNQKLRAIIKDTANAVKGDTDTLLNE